MSRTCIKCGKQYEVSALRFDRAICADHDVSFWPEEITSPQTPTKTRSIWLFLLIVHVILAMGCYTGWGDAEESVLLVYSVAIVLYFAVRFAIAMFRGYPVLTQREAVALATLPLWGWAAFMGLFVIVQYVRFGSL
jgi:hypothetical protein